jgi:hypothetical protein
VILGQLHNAIRLFAQPGSIHYWGIQWPGSSPPSPFCPRILEKQHLFLADLLHVKDGITMLAFKTKVPLLSGRHLSGAHCDESITIDEAVVDPIPELIRYCLGPTIVSTR